TSPACTGEIRKGYSMALSFTVGGARGKFEKPFAEKGAGASAKALGTGGEWGGSPPLPTASWAEAGCSRSRGGPTGDLGLDAIPNLAALGEDGRGVYLPAQVQTISLPLSAGAPLRCASLPGLRNELAELARRWDLPLDDDGLYTLLRVAQDPDDGWVAD